jgi:hypothetical protein
MADLIDRQELLKHKGNCYDEGGHLLYAVGTGTILLMPTVDAEVIRHGHWIATGNEYFDKWICSKCKHAKMYKDNYCSFCGAKMDEVKDEESV